MDFVIYYIQILIKRQNSKSSKILLQAMYTFYIPYETQFCLKSKNTQQFVGIQTNTQILRANYLPSHIQTNDIRSPTQKPNYTLKIKILNRDQQKQLFLQDGSKVHLINSYTDQYITCSSIGQIKFDKKSNISEEVNKHLYKASTWTVQLLRNQNKIIQTQKENISVYDQICFKSVHSTYLTIRSTTFQLYAVTQLDPSKSVWNLHKGNVPTAPQWLYKRQFFTKFAQCNITNLRSSSIQSSGREKRPLHNYPVQIQQALLVEDFIDVMNGFQGIYIKRNVYANQFAIQPYFQQPTCSLALKQLTQKALVLPMVMLKVQSYIQTYGIQQGVINQALCGGFKLIMKDWKKRTACMDFQACEKGQGLTLQKILYLNQTTLKISQSISNLIIQAQKYKGGQLLTLLHRVLNQNTDDAIVSIVQLIYAKISFAYVLMLSKWLYQGVIQDKYGQFMIMAEQKSQNKQWNYWQQKYLIRQNMVPSIFQKYANQILITGKYLNILKACKKLPENKIHKQISKNFDKYNKIQNFSQPILQVYQWTNSQMLRLIYQEYKFENVLKSIKGFFFLQYGDLFVHFMDSAEEDLSMLKKKGSQGQKGKIFSEQKIQSLFELLIRTSSANDDQFKQQVTCRVQNTTIYDQMHRIKTLQPEKLNFDFSQKPFVKRDSKYVDFLTLQYQCKFPLTLIFNKKSMSKYQLLFRYIFWCKFVERQLNNVWLALRQMKLTNLSFLVPAYALNQRMINFIKNFIYYLCYEVIQKNWLAFNQKLKKLNTLQDIIVAHSQFLNKCLKQSLLSNNRLLTILTSQIGKAIQNFTNIKSMITRITQECQFQPLPVNQKNPSLLKQRQNHIQQLTRYAQQFLKQKDFRKIIQTNGLEFDDSMRKFLREIYSIIGKQENYLLNLVYRLDEEKFYNKRLFKGANQSMFN